MSIKETNHTCVLRDCLWVAVAEKECLQFSFESTCSNVEMTVDCGCFNSSLVSAVPVSYIVSHIVSLWSFCLLWAYFLIKIDTGMNLHPHLHLVSVKLSPPPHILSPFPLSLSPFPLHPHRSCLHPSPIYILTFSSTKLVLLTVVRSYSLLAVWSAYRNIFLSYNNYSYSRPTK